ncbi:MAG: RNA repair transcriptional activator RtcR [Planctomycetota bacterium]|jgi:transcriptional regulatory protein RtcR|nr:RNA repair transcriptional activator RtcR [Planctomycetota bacterium]
MAKRSQNRPLVVIGMLGVNLDASSRDRSRRWDKWRPSLSICRHEDLAVDRFELIHSRGHRSIAEALAGDMRLVSPETGVNLYEVDTRDPWDFEEVYAGLYDFTRAYAWKHETEDYLVHITTGTHVAQICLFLLTESRHFPAKLLQTSPPRNPGDDKRGTYAIIDLDLSKYDRLASRFEKSTRDDLAFLKSGIDTRSRRFNLLIERIERVAVRSTEPILLIGPPGAGKSQLGRRLYELKKQRRLVAGSFVEINCATLRGDQAMATLFGHAKGAFTGAVDAREGLLRKADGGVLFLDEIGELGLDEQAMLLRAVEEKRFLPLGSDGEAFSDFQLIAGTNRDLAREIAAGTFREDLLARIDLWTFRLPGLAERREDIAPNLDYELERAGGRLGRRVTMNREAREAFLAFARSDEAPWRANFRDLAGAVMRMSTLAEGGRISLSEAKLEIARLKSQWSAVGAKAVAGQEGGPALSRIPGFSAEALDPFDRIQLEKVVEACLGAGSLSEAGRRLFCRSRLRRKTPNDADRLRKYLARFGLTWQDIAGRKTGFAGE